MLGAPRDSRPVDRLGQKRHQAEGENPRFLRVWPCSPPPRRFLHLLREPDRRRMSGAYAALPGIHEGAIVAQISSPPLSVRGQDVARAPQVADLVITVGDYTGPKTAVIAVADPAVTPGADRLHLVCRSRRRLVHTMLLNAVDLTLHTHPLARFTVS
ncbi:lantibiotic dehydratase [Streptomyces virginiae]|uniref:lantibiotic dehydratase n=1 Tax=Streptomyces virginiae TaxID=1961 RepID=UPI0036CC735E